LEINLIPLDFEIKPNDYKLNKNFELPITYLLGIMEGDGSFNISFLSSSAIYKFEFSVTTSIEDITILILIKLRLGCGKIEVHKTWCRFLIHKADELINIIIPLVDSIPSYRKENLSLITSKKRNYDIWKEGIIKHKNKNFAYKLTDNKRESLQRKKELINFIILAYNVHDSGKKRKLTLSQFLKIHNLKN